jgi:hypothetical protein
MPGEKDWKEALPEDIRSDASLAAIQDVPGLAKSYIHSQKLVGADKIALPGKEATEEDWGQVFTKLGRPETIDGYELKKPDNFPEGLDYNETMLTGFKETAHKLGLLPSQVAGLHDWWNNANIEGFTASTNAQKEALEAAETALKQEYGNAYDQKLATAQTALKEFGGDELVKFIDDSGLGNNPHFIKLMATVGEGMLEDGLKGNGQHSDAITPADAQKKIATIMTDKTSPYHARYHADHQRIVEEVQKLYSQAYPESKES